MATVDRDRRNQPADPEEAPRTRQRGAVAPYTFYGFLLLLMLSWLFGFFLQRGFPGGSPAWWQTYVFQVPPAVVESFLSWSALRHVLIPMLLGCGFAWLIGAGYVQEFYKLPGRTAAFSYLLDVVISLLLPGDDQQARARSTSSRRMPGPSRRHLIGLAILFSLISLGPAVVFSIYGLFWSLEAEAIRRYQFLATLFVMTWLVVVGPGLLWFLSGRLLHLAGGSLSVIRTNLEESQEKDLLWRIGGPGTLNVKARHAVAVTEQNGRLLRILGPGKHKLTAYERIRTMLSLQIYEHDAEVELFTRDGIKAKVQLAITYRIAPDDALMRITTFDSEIHQQLTDQIPAATPEQPYRFGEAAVRSVATIAIVDEDQRVTKWHKLPFPVVSGQLKREVAQYRLNELFVPHPGLGIRHLDVYESVLRKGREILHPLGIELIDMRLGPLEAGERVMDAYLELWRAVWQKRREVELAQSQAKAIEELGSGVGEMEVAALQTIAEALQRARKQNDLESVRPLVALRLIDALERLARETTGLADPGSADLMKQLRALRRRLDEDGISRQGDETGQAS